MKKFNKSESFNNEIMPSSENIPLGNRGGNEVVPEKKHKELQEKFLKIVNEILNNYPYAETREVIADTVLGKVPKEKLEESFALAQEEKKKDEQLRKKIESMGILSYCENLPIVDIERLKKLFTESREWEKEELKNWGRYNLKMRSLASIINRAFINFPVISKEDFEKGIRVPKPLFYEPRSLNDALDPAKIKQSDFYFLRSEIMSFMTDDINNHQFPLIFEKITYNEIEIAAVIYHPRFGDGYRDKNGVLFVRNQKTREYQPISVDWLFSQKGSLPNSGLEINTVGGKKKKIFFASSPRAYLESGGLTNLLEKGLLKPEDFKITSGLAAEMGLRWETEIHKNGQIFLGGVRYFLGRKLAGEKFIKLREDLGGIVHIDPQTKKENLIYTFRLFKPEETARKIKDGKKRQRERIYSYVGGKKELELTPYVPEKYHPPKRADETDEQYEKRVRVAEDFAQLLEFSNNLPLLIKQKFYELPFSEQRIISSAFKSVGEDIREKFIEKFGFTGLKAMISADYGRDFVKKIMIFSEKAPFHEANEIFEEYNKIIELAREFENIGEEISRNVTQLSEELKIILPHELKEAILRRATDLFAAAYLITDNPGKFELKNDDVTFALRGLKTFLDILKSFHDDEKYALKLTKKENNIFTFVVSDRENKNEYILNILLRPEEHHREGAARLQFILNFESDHPNEELRKAFHQWRCFKDKNKLKKESSLRVSIDRDVRENREEISLDVGRAKFEDENLSYSGDVLGNALALVTKEGHHNTKSIDQRFAEKGVFRELVLSFEKFLSNKFEIGR
jgi:hypothetical protein